MHKRDRKKKKNRTPLAATASQLTCGPPLEQLSQQQSFPPLIIPSSTMDSIRTDPPSLGKAAGHVQNMPHQQGRNAACIICSLPRMHKIAYKWCLVLATAICKEKLDLEIILRKKKHLPSHICQKLVPTVRTVLQSLHTMHETVRSHPYIPIKNVWNPTNTASLTRLSVYTALNFF